MKTMFRSLFAIVSAIALLVGCAGSSDQKNEVKQTKEVGSQVEVNTPQERSEATPSGEPIFTVVEEMPQYPGGAAELLKYIASNVKYPEAAKEAGVQGRVICSFVVLKDGSISDYRVVRSISTELDAEAIRVLKQMPRWTPGRQGGKPVAVKYTLPVTFRLQ